MRKVSIYTLSCPIRNVVMYVGKSFAPKARYKAHIAEARVSQASKKNRWLFSLLVAGHEPIMTVIELCEQPEQRIREAYWIDYHRHLNPLLTNRTMPNAAIPISMPSEDDETIAVTIRVSGEVAHWIKENARIGRRSLNAQTGLIFEKYKATLPRELA